MQKKSNRWALVLAAGAGTRLSGLTKIAGGDAVPKQFCSLHGGHSLLEETIQRASALVPPERTVVLVAAEHRRFWTDGIRGVPEDNVIVQPANRGTAIGILLGATVILKRDAQAVLAVLPSDHFVEHEAALWRGISRGFAASDLEPQSVSFLGLEPEYADPELGYIVRGPRSADGNHRIAEFVEKPDHDGAAELLARSALWNLFIMAARAETLVRLIDSRVPDSVQAVLDVVADGDCRRNSRALRRLYSRLPVIDFSRHVIQGSNADFNVIPVSNCGWTDLGTPARVAACLERVGPRRRAPRTSHLNLAEAHSLWTHEAAVTA
jgi:mannose-1-phosphate guanylyltransferase